MAQHRQAGGWRLTAATEVVILGGGPAGCATALALVARGVDPAGIVVLEASGYEHERIGESIPPNSRALLAELGVLEAFLREDHEACNGSMSSWGADALGYNDFITNPYGHGWHLDRRRFDRWLAEEVGQRGVSVRTGVRLAGVLARDDAGFELELRVGGQARERMRAGFVVDATGPRSRFARRLGATRRTVDLLVSTSGYFVLPKGEEFARMTVLEAVEHGWWYAARLPGRRVAVALATSHALHKQHRFDRPRPWLEALARTRHVMRMLARCEPVAGSLSVCTAPSFVLEPVGGARWLAVGDAASAFDPISSQGIWKALEDGLRAGQAIAQWRAGGAGDEALEGHRAAVEQRFEGYLQQRAYFYEQEQRWRDAPFWRERQGASTG